MKLTNTWNKLAKQKQRIIVQQGGTSSGKTYATLQLLILLAQKKENILISVVAESMPHLKRGAMRDFFKILMSEGIYEPKNHNKTDAQYKINNSLIEFFGADSADKMRGSRRDILYINECNNVPYTVYDQLEVRTKERIYLDYNPVSEFWVHDRVLPLPNVGYVHSTYKDNDQLDEQIIKSIESRRGIDENWWRVYGLGEVGSLEGVVYKNWDIVDKVPEEAKLIGAGLDFGYEHSKTALVVTYIYDNELYHDEIIHETGLQVVPTEDKDGKVLKNIHDEAIKKGFDINMLTVCDSAEPRSRKALQAMGWSIIATKKLKDDINAGITLLRGYKQHITKRSVGTIKDFRNYQYAEDKDGKLMNVPQKRDDDSPDAIRYNALKNIRPVKSFSWLDQY